MLKSSKMLAFWNFLYFIFTCLDNCGGGWLKASYSLSTKLEFYSGSAPASSQPCALVSVSFSVPVKQKWDVPAGAPVAAEPKSHLLSGQLAVMLLNPSSAALYNFLVCPCLKLVLLWGFGPWVTWLPRALLSLTRLRCSEFCKNARVCSCNSQQCRDLYLVFLQLLAIIIHVRKIHLC